MLLLALLPDLILCQILSSNMNLFHVFSFLFFSFKVWKNLGLVELQKAKSSFGLITLKELKIGEIFAQLNMCVKAGYLLLLVPG